jgi:hypothetical protein
MKRLAKPPASWNLEEANGYLLVLGVGMIGLGVLIPGTRSGTVSLLITLGAAIAVVGILSPRFSQLEIKPLGIKMGRDSGAPMPLPWLAAEAETLDRIAKLVLGDHTLAREAVEVAISRVRKHRADIPRTRTDLARLKTLVALLESQEKQIWFRGDHVSDESDEIQAALRKFPIETRIAFALSLEFPDSEVAQIVGRSEKNVAAEVSAVRNAVAPYLEKRKAIRDD